ncbi:inactive protein RESTRICTED TEV MOVEMENT 2 [Arachis duranensis]|uniref:Inactive protein RESTRICTED TEV MOVEMENT 2 n=1 Tax=Arachis duranensis TaxID=130453 RepID=A0A9C6WKR4_ARADU|nr:inactive protein RESTRICTED TEV MOVEMENT 2 [Arachis duranensis]
MAMNQGNAQLEYQDIEPPFDWDHKKESDTLIVSVPGFKREQLRVQVTSTRLIRLSGERRIGDSNKIRKFYKELPIPSDTDTSSISAKFENGILYVKLPKLITSIDEPPVLPPTPAPAPSPAPTTAPTTSSVVRPQQQPQPQSKPEPPISHYEDQQKQRVVDKAPASASAPALTPAPAPAPAPVSAPVPTPIPQLEENKNNDDNIARKGGKDDKKGVIDEGTSSRVKEMQGRMGKSEGEGEGSKLGLGLEKRLSTVSRQGEEYRNAVYGLVEELKKQKKIANLVVVMFLVVLLVLYVNNAIKSSFGGAGPKIQEL